MFPTSIGPFDGDSWENLCQLVFKKKYLADGYQEMPASPGDFGLEGFTLLTGYAFQCYCPDKLYPHKELYNAQRDKITADLGKLKKYEQEISERIGTAKIERWIFVTPQLDKNLLLAHARAKEKEVREWKLSILEPNFSVHLHDLGYYLTEINEIRSAQGTALTFDSDPPVLVVPDGSQEDYERNISRKSLRRLELQSAHPSHEKRVRYLQSQTLRTFLEADGYFRRIERDAPTVYYRLIRLINEYQNHVEEASNTWSGTPDELTAYVREGLEDRICQDLAPEMDRTVASQVARHVIARWLAMCELDYE